MNCNAPEHTPCKFQKVNISSVDFYIFELSGFRFFWFFSDSFQPLGLKDWEKKSEWQRKSIEVHLKQAIFLDLTVKIYDS